MNTKPGRGPWDLYTSWTPEDDNSQRLTFSGAQVPRGTDPVFGELTWLIEGYLDSFAGMVLCDDANNGEDTNARISQLFDAVRPYAHLGEIEYSSDGLELAALLGAFGLLRVDELVAALKPGVDAVRLVLLWERMTDAHCEGVAAYLRATETSHASAKRALASHAANIRHSKSPQALAKAFVKECWALWRLKPEQYSGPTAFARDMLGKCPDVLRSEVVVMRWVRAWDEEET